MRYECRRKERFKIRLQYMQGSNLDKEKDKWLEVMRHAIALNASFFNTQRMVQEYVLNAYL